jgi:hypothetical protein
VLLHHTILRPQDTFRGSLRLLAQCQHIHPGSTPSSSLCLVANTVNKRIQATSTTVKQRVQALLMAIWVTPILERALTMPRQALLWLA